MAHPSRAYPGLPLGSASQYGAGPGTHVHAGAICASLIGGVSVGKPSTNASLPTLSVSRPTALSVSSTTTTAAASSLPAVGSIVLARVSRIQARQVNASILVVDDQVCADAFQGIVRKEDVRGWEVDKVVLGDSFRVGDVIRGVVVSRFPRVLKIGWRRRLTMTPLDLARRSGFVLS
jgi:exosome complex component CSL4